ncbi:VanZ family protein [Sphingobacterium daejeonense]|jgi:VanZ family protein|uniref:VanZ family protein n=1 Tax=Sphingobacterium daejeonense TaxID=371142 RepID=A0ABW3RGS2_9SPHI|nr:MULTISPECIES: VanZ family protein [Sphingobacterium]MCT1531063.1 VanZ family protein [Sphingobacterium daejeonense]VTP86540.1 Predicted integral membrane protein [Sphingobacterium daejeonense]
MNWIINYAWAILWAIIMMLLMLLPANDIPVDGFFPGFDKLVHTGSFYLLTTLILFGRLVDTKRRATKVKTFIVVFCVASLFAFFTEGAQMYFTNTRQADWWDIFADYVGIGMALFSYLLLYNRKFQYS